MTTPKARDEPRSASFVTVAGFMSTFKRRTKKLSSSI